MNLKVIHIRFPISGQDFLLFIYLKKTGYHTMDGTYNLEVSQRFHRVDSYSTEQLVMGIAVQVLGQLSVRKNGYMTSKAFTPVFLLHKGK